MSQLITPKPKLKHFRALPTGEVSHTLWDVVRIIRDTKVHMVVYRGIADLDTAQLNKVYLQNKTGDVCYVIGRKTKRMVRKRNGFT
jgi:hypothetical protein